MNPSSPNFLLQWRGQQTGPWPLDRIEQALSAGEIHSMYQIQADGEWRPLRDFLEGVRSQRGAHQAGAAAASQVRHEYEGRLAAEQAEALRLRQQLQPARSRPAPPPLPQDGGAGMPPPIPNHIWTSAAPPPYQRVPMPRTNGMAVASFVLSLCFFIPLVSFVSWLLSLIFGHIALYQIKRDPGLSGRGFAIAGLIITYLWIVFSAVVIAVVVLSNRNSAV